MSSSPTPHPESAPRLLPHGPAPARRWLASLAGAQEVGLIVVILLMSIGLTFASGTANRKDRTNLPQGSTIASGDDAGFKVQFGAGPAGAGSGGAGEVRAYAAADGFSYVETEPGSIILIHERKINRFLNADNLINLLTYASFIAIMAVGMNAVIILNGIDLSIGSIYALSAVSGAWVLNMMAERAGGEASVSAWASIPVGILVCCFVGGACGAINGIGTVGLRVHPFIITLGGMAVYRGLAFVLSEGKSIGGLPDSYRDSIRATWQGMNFVPTLVMVLMGAIGAIVMSRTVWGRRVFAIGGNETAARYAGVPVGLIKITVFTLAGVLAGLSAAIVVGHLGAASADSGTGYELSVIAAAVVGGAALSGGRGSAIGAVLGALVIQLINNGFDLVGSDQSYRQIVIGLAIVLAVVVDQTKHRLTSTRRH